MNTKCPSDDIMAGYLDGVLAVDEQAKLDAHIADCGICLDTITEGNRLLRGGNVVDTEPVPAFVTQSAIDAIQRKTDNGVSVLARKIKYSAKAMIERISDAVLISSGGSLHPAPIRGSKEKLGDDRVLLKKTFTEIDTEIEMEKSLGEAIHLRVRLAGASRAERGIRVSLQKSEREVFSQLLGSDYVLFEDVPYNRYTLIFSRNGRSLGAFAFEIKETMND